MTPQEATVANTDIWAHYFEQEWKRWLQPWGEPASDVAQGTAARVANFLTLVAAGPIAWMYAANAPEVTPPRAHAVAPSTSIPDSEPAAA